METDFFNLEDYEGMKIWIEDFEFTSDTEMEEYGPLLEMILNGRAYEWFINWAKEPFLWYQFSEAATTAFKEHKQGEVQADEEGQEEDIIDEEILEVLQVLERDLAQRKQYDDVEDLEHAQATEESHFNIREEIQGEVTQEQYKDNEEQANFSQQISCKVPIDPALHMHILFGSFVCPLSFPSSIAIQEPFSPQPIVSHAPNFPNLSFFVGQILIPLCNPSPSLYSPTPLTPINNPQQDTLQLQSVCQVSPLSIISYKTQSNFFHASSIPYYQYCLFPLNLFFYLNTNSTTLLKSFFHKEPLSLIPHPSFSPKKSYGSTKLIRTYISIQDIFQILSFLSIASKLCLILVHKSSFSFSYNRQSSILNPHNQFCSQRLHVFFQNPSHLETKGANARQDQDKTFEIPHKSQDPFNSEQGVAGTWFQEQTSANSRCLSVQPQRRHKIEGNLHDLQDLAGGGWKIRLSYKHFSILRGRSIILREGEL